MTFEDVETRVTFRSVRGANLESNHVFVQQLPARESASILELGFGGGTNAANTFLQPNRAETITYVALEPNPIDPDQWLVDRRFRDALDSQVVVEQFSLEVISQTWQSFETDRRFDVYFHDPFGPKEAPDCWTVECFAWAAGLLEDDGILTTYGASTAARRAMKDAGLFVGSLPGVGGKREMTVASLDERRIAHAKPWKRS